MRSPISILAVTILFLATGCAGPRHRAENRPIFLAERSLKQARSVALAPEVRAGHYLDAASAASGIFAGQDEAQVAAAPMAKLIYNAASAELTVLLRGGKGRLWGRELLIPSQENRPPYRLRVQPAISGQGKGLPGLWTPDYFTAFKPAGKVSWKGFRRQITQPGFGGPLVGIRNLGDEGRPPEAFSYLGRVTAPVTATLDFARIGSASGSGKMARPASSPSPVTVTLALSNPIKRQTAPIAGVERPLAADFTAPLAYYPRRSEFWAGLMAMIHVRDYIGKTGLYMLEPYDPDRIPVIFIHGLASTPQMWLDVINEIESDPRLRSHCQYWVFRYPTGNAMVYSAMRMREDLAAVERACPMPRGCVIVGHSMGGLVARLQATTSGRSIWNAGLKKQADKLYDKLPPDTLLKRVAIFEADPHVKRLVFICVPHRGSDLAITSIGALATRFIALPSSMIQGLKTTLGGSFEVLTGAKGARCPTSIQSLSPKSPTLLALDRLPIHAPYHSIIGDRGKGNTPDSSDGIVPYWSSNLAGAQSELIVPGTHGSTALPQTVAELRRILNQHIDAEGR